MRNKYQVRFYKPSSFSLQSYISLAIRNSGIGQFACKIINLAQTYSVTEFPSPISAKLAEPTNFMDQKTYGKWIQVPGRTYLEALLAYIHRVSSTEMLLQRPVESACINKFS